MSDELEKLQEMLLAHALPLVPFEGWTDACLAHAVQSAGLPEAEAKRVFPEGPVQCLTFFSRLADRRVTEALSARSLETMKIRDRVAAAVMLRLDQNLPHREAIRRGSALLSFPTHAALAVQLLYQTVDAIWHALGDRSTDFNFYTKRLMLAGVYSGTLLVWLDDTSGGQQDTRAFLARRIEDVMKIEKAKTATRGWLQGFKAWLPRRRAA